jgi:transposase
MTARLDMTREARAARREQVARLTRSGHSATDIAFILGVSIRTVTRNRALAGLTVGYIRPSEPSEEQLAAAKAMLLDGACYPEVARTLGFSATTWRKRIPGFEWSYSQSGQQARAMQMLGRAAGLRR